MAARCFPFAQGRRMRVTAVDNCGNPTEDDCGQVVSKGFVQISVSSQMEAGTSIVGKNANGELCYQVRSVDQFLRHEIELQFCEVDPTLFSIVTHVNTVDDYDSDAVGFQTKEGGAETGYALEVWMGVPGEECPDDGDDSLGYVLLPWIMPGVLGDYTIQDDGVTFSIGGFTKGAGGWGVGPYDVVPTDASHTPGPLLEALPTDVHAHMQWTSISAPDPFCGCLPVSGS